MKAAVKARAGGRGSPRRGTATFRCYAVAAPGLAPLVASELRALGIEGTPDEGGVAWEGEVDTVYRANLWLRTATRVLVRVATFRATTFWELERRSAPLPWGEFVRPGGAAAFRVTAKKSKLYHTDAIAERLATSLAASVPGVRIGRAGADDDEAEESGAEQLFVVRVARDEVTVSADSSGAPLYQRGYRQAVAKAPLRETLAAGLLLGAGWRPGEPLVDPFCGSGTIPLEAALMTLGIAPGLATAGRAPREFACVNWPVSRGGVWRKCVDDAASMAREAEPLPILGSDRDEGAIAAARGNAARAGLEGVVSFDACPVSAMRTPAQAGWVVTNPPYGVRVGELADVRRLYAAFGRVLRDRAAGWGVALLSPDGRLDGITAKEAGIRLEERFRTRNGGIPVRAVSGR